MSDEFEGQQEIERSLMLKQIARIVADAKANNTIVHTSHHAARLFADFPHANLPVARIVDEIVHAAADARVTSQNSTGGLVSDPTSLPTKQGWGRSGLPGASLACNESTMQSEELLRIAREIVDKVTYCFAVTASGDGAANARIVQPRKLQNDWTVDFTTNRKCRKFEEIEQTGKLTLAYQHDPDRAYVCLIGNPRIIDDVELKRSRWSPEADRWHPGGPDDPNVVFIRLVTDRIELWSSVHNVMPEPKGLSAAVLVSDGSAWRYFAT